MSAYKFIDHKFDVVVVGAGGSGLRAALAQAARTVARAAVRPSRRSVMRVSPSSDAMETTSLALR